MVGQVGDTMHRSARGPSALLLALLILVCGTQSLFAYVDPGSASYFFQFFIGGVLGAAFTVKLYWRKVKMLFRKSGVRKENGMN